jgi:LPXTG-motif cell wall-anchored protein
MKHHDLQQQVLSGQLGEQFNMPGSSQILQSKYTHKVKVLSYSVLGLTVLAILLVVIFKRKKHHKA